ncbi:MAG TPA: DUF4129 domain-containing protein [Anaerolineae bacterium]|nr:DUF4129 domain-containing protein [Anaerolineae bacterium]HQK15687.1 DUF4129 domain-containing protein [Anaerolineae bacterium]
MVKRRKLWILLITGVAIVALLLLSSSLTGLELLPGKPFPWGLLSGKADSTPPPYVGNLSGMVAILRVVMVILFFVSLLYAIFTKEGRRRFIRLMIQIALFMLLMSYVLERQSAVIRTPAEITTAISPLEEVTLEPAPEFIPGDMRDLTNTLSVVMGVGLTVIILSTLYVLWRRNRAAKDDALAALVREAQDALDTIQAGGDLKNAVIRCYFEMSRVISEKRNIQRGVTMTPREFEEQLFRAGLPKAPIQQLTRLFEDARYGDRDPGPAEEQRAVACLSAIVSAATEGSR